MMYCQECGMKLPDNAKFCSNCGTEVNLPVKKLKKENKKSKKKLLGIIAGVFVMLAVVVGGFFVYLENRTLFYLINPEMFFGECTDYVIFRSAPGRSWVELEFEAETDFFE
ncbi:MAG: zinc ribbon domain-containing protein, partial [Eubacterium sp.]|nr:zinc ribbon domain-containing protein [Eubacterium sp.]